MPDFDTQYTESRLGRHARLRIAKELQAYYLPLIKEQLPETLLILVEQIREPSSTA